MSMQPVPWPEPDAQVAAAIAGMYGNRKTERPVAVEIRDRLGQWLEDEEFAAAFGIRGKPGWSPSRLALVTVLQRAEKLTDRLATDAVRARLDWKYLLGLSLGDPGSGLLTYRPADGVLRGVWPGIFLDFLAVSASGRPGRAIK